MAGSPTWGKMSAGMRSSASTAQRAIAVRATTTVNGLLSAAKTRRMLLTCLRQEWLNVSGGGGHREQPAPDAEPGQRVVDIGLREQALRFGYLIDVAQARLIAGRGLLDRGARGGHLGGSVGGDFAGALKCRDGRIPLGAQIDGDLAVSGRLRADRGRLRGFTGLNRRQIKSRESHAETERVVLHTGGQAVDAAEQLAIGLRAGAASVSGAL